MRKLTTEEIHTLSIKVTEEINRKNLYKFVRTAILNSDFPFSKNTHYSFYYNSNTLTYEILFFDNTTDTYLEAFSLLRIYKRTDKLIQVLLCENYFLIIRENKLLILKKFNSTTNEEVLSYIQQMYKIEEFDIIEVKKSDLEYSNEDKLHSGNSIYPLYVKKSFYYFLSFLFISLCFLITIIYWNYERSLIQTNSSFDKTNQSQKNNKNERVTKNIVSLFQKMKNYNIKIEKISYINHKIKTILESKDESNLLAFTSSYSKEIQIKSLKYNEEKKLYVMEVTIEY